MPTNPNRAPSHRPAQRALSRAEDALVDAAVAVEDQAVIRTNEERWQGLARAALRYAAAVARAAEGAKR